MGKRMNKLLKWLVVGAAVCLSVVCCSCAKGCSCSKKKNNDDSSPSLTSEYTLSLSKNEMSLTVWEQERLFVSYDGTESVVWSVENPAIATVDEGIITGVSVGTTKIIVTAGEETEECVLSVTAQSQDLFALEIDDTNVEIYKGDSVRIQATATYDGREISDVEYSYYSYNDSVATVGSNGVVNAEGLGQATIVVTAKAADLETAHAVNVEVCPLGRIAISQPKVELYAVESVGGSSYQIREQLNVVAYEKDEAVENATIVYDVVDDAQDVFTVNDDGLITAVNAGKSYLSVAYTGSDEVTVESEICVIVHYVENTIHNEPIFVENVNESYTLNYMELFGEEIEPTSAELIRGVSRTETEVDGEVWSLENVAAGEQILNLKTRNVHYHVNVDVWTKEIRVAQDMQVLYSATNGRYRLASDVDMSGEIWENLQEIPFTGEFDGQGYTISNLVQRSGLFNKIGARAKLQRIVLTNGTFAEGATGIGALCNTLCGARVSLSDIHSETLSLGQTNGGLIGNVEEHGSVSVESSYVRFFSKGDETDSGAIVAACLGQVTLADTAVVSSSQICGVKSDSKNSLTVANALNSTKGICKQAVRLENINAWDFDTNEEVLLTLPNTVGAVNAMRIYHTDTFDVSVTERQYLLSSEILDGQTSGKINIWVSNTAGEEFYYIHELVSEGILTQANCQKLLTVTTGKITLGENIDLSGIEWKSQTTFSGVLDGAGYTISNLTSNDNGTGLGCGLFKTLKDATIKNLEIKNHNVVDGINQYGVLATNVAGAVTVENVIIASDFTPVNYGGMFRSIDSHSCKVTLKNVIMQASKADALTAWGFIAGFAGKSGGTTQVSVSVENCYFIGGNGAACGERKNYPGVELSAEQKYYSDLVAFKNGQVAMPTEFLSDWYEKL